MNRAKFEYYEKQFSFLSEVLRGVDDPQMNECDWGDGEFNYHQALHGAIASVRIQRADANLFARKGNKESQSDALDYTVFAAVWRRDGGGVEVELLESSWSNNRGYDGWGDAPTIGEQLAGGEPPVAIVEVGRSEQYQGPIYREVVIHRVDPRWMNEITRRELHLLADQLADELEEA